MGLTAGGFPFILAGVIANMHTYFQPATPFNTIVMLILLVCGLSLVASACGDFAVLSATLKDTDRRVLSISVHSEQHS